MINLEKIQGEVVDKIASVTSIEELEKVRVELLGKKGLVVGLMQEMKNIDPSDRPEYGKQVNVVKDYAEQQIKDRKSSLEVLELERKLESEKIDLTLPGIAFNQGTKHPLTIINNELNEAFIAMGYKIVEGPEVELDLYNFERANIPQDHPARDMQDTFFIDVNHLLRTHTTAIQTRELEKNKDNLPIKILCPGKTYRRDSDDATHSHQFMQTEGLVVGEGVKLTDLKGTLEVLVKKMFGEKRNIRLRPSYFQFTEPSVEVDVSCMMCNGKGCRICKESGWIEILGAGMVHPNVLEMAGIDSKKYSGFAFGIGIERTAMLKYSIDDIRGFYTNDERFLKQFTRFE